MQIVGGDNEKDTENSRVIDNSFVRFAGVYFCGF